MNHAITRCPKCATSFRITQNQLKTAKGAVRCGSCLTVFQAGAHLIQGAEQKADNLNVVPSKSPAPKIPASKTQAAKVQRSQVQRAKTQNTAQKTVQKPSKLPEGNAQASPVKKAKAAPPKNTTAVREVIRDPKAARDPKAISDAQKVRVAKAPVTQAKPRTANPSSVRAENTQPKKQAISPKAYIDSDDMLISDDMDGDSSHFDEVTNELNVTGTRGALSHSLFERDPTKRAESPENVDDDSWALSLLDEQDTKLHRESTSRSAEVSDDDVSEIDLSGKSIYSEGGFELHDDFIEAAGISTQPKASQGNKFDINDIHDVDDEEPEELPVFEFDEPLEDRESDTSINLFSNIEPEPVEFSYRRKRPFWRSRSLYAGLSIACILGLIIQVAIMRFDSLSLKEPYRAAYGVACRLVGCQLPNLKDTSKIRINQLMVRSHPTTANALIVDAVILNNANFEQGFPDLTLTFTDMQNKPIASRSFTPREYLNGELKGYALMPSLQPITLNFQIVDPGAKAVNYLLTIAQ